MTVITATYGTILSALFVACATIPKRDDTSATKIDPTAVSELKLDIISSKFSTNLVDYTFSGKPYKAQWSSCVAKEGQSFAVFFHGATKLIDGENFCQDWTAQVLLKNGYNVIAVSRPSFLGSTGSDDMAGPQSVAANLAGIGGAAANHHVIGFWGIDYGVIAASFTAKVTKNLNWLLLGNGFYDVEIIERSTKNDTIRKDIQNQKSIAGEAALEQRSIAWDSSGLPKIIALYHTADNEDAPKVQADSFNDSLRTAQTKVFYDNVVGAGSTIPWQDHFQIVDKALSNLK
jgi:hypothetical protein